MKTGDIARKGLLISVSLILSYVESLVPVFVAIPGIKMGLANIVVVFALYRMNFRTAFTVSILRVLLSSLLFGSVLSLAYSLSGATISVLVMFILKKTDLFSTLAVSVAGAVFHNLAQIATACFLLDTKVVAYYIPFLLISGIISGTVIGILAAAVVKRVDL